jgi:hypothetical protein
MPFAKIMMSKFKEILQVFALFIYLLSTDMNLYTVNTVVQDGRCEHGDVG